MKLSRDKINHISGLIVKEMDQWDDFDYKLALNEIRLEVADVMFKEIRIDDQADVEARRILSTYSDKNLREGSPEWEILYQKHFNEHMVKRGL